MAVRCGSALFCSISSALNASQVEECYDEWIRNPNAAGMVAGMHAFSRWDGFLNAAAAADGVQFDMNEPIIPAADRPAYYNRHSSYSIAAQAIVDRNGCFMVATPCLPGSVHDSKCWENSGLEAEFAGVPHNAHCRAVLTSRAGIPLSQTRTSRRWESGMKCARCRHCCWSVIKPGGEVA